MTTAHDREPGICTRVLLCDDHELVRRGVATLLNETGDLTVVGEAGSADEAVTLAAELNPDVVIMDVRMPGRSGIEACRDILSLRENTRVIMLTSYAEDEAMLSSIIAGAAGFFLKGIRSAELLTAIRHVAAGGSLIEPAARERAQARLRGEVELAGPGGEHLTHQEARILTLVADGMTNRQISECLGLSEKTVKNYVSNVLGKLGLTRRTQAASFVTRSPWAATYPMLKGERRDAETPDSRPKTLSGPPSPAPWQRG
jgi:two-component system, NarL family, response regulator DevR